MEKKLALVAVTLLMCIAFATSAPLSELKKAKTFVCVTGDENELFIHYFIDASKTYQGYYLYRIFSYYPDLEKGQLVTQFQVKPFRSSVNYILEQTCPRGGDSWVSVSVFVEFPGGPALGMNDEVTLTRLAKRVRIEVGGKIVSPKYVAFTGTSGCAVFPSFKSDVVRVGFIGEKKKFISYEIAVQDAQ
jgi:hypothetical protein